MLLLAIEAMDPTVQAVFYLVAVMLAVLAAFGVTAGRAALFPLAFAAFVIPFAWNAFAAS